MATVKRFEDLKVWQKARELSNRISKLTQIGKFSRDYPLKYQINRSSGSIMDNIAEGFGRQGNNEFIHFLTIANGSCMEVRSQLYRANDREYISQEEFIALIQTTEEITRMLASLISYLSKSDFRGQNYKLREKQSASTQPNL